MRTRRGGTAARTRRGPRAQRFGIATTVALGALGAAAVFDERRVARDPAWAYLGPPPEGRKIDVRGSDGTRLHCDVLGPTRRTDAPTIVLVHGWTCRREFWAPQLNALSDRYRLVAYDLRGHGRSAAPAGGDFSPEALADDLAAVLETTVPADQPALLVGHSLGAMSIVAWAGRHARQVRHRAAAALLLSTGTSDLITESLVLKPPAGLSKPGAAVARTVMGSSLPVGSRSPISHRLVRYVALSPSASPAEVRFCEEIILGTDRRWRAATARTLSGLDLDSAIEHLAVPTLVLGGDADRLTPPVLSKRLAEHLPDLVERVELPGVGHMTPIEAHDEVNRRIEALAERFLSGASPAGVPALSAR